MSILNEKQDVVFYSGICVLFVFLCCEFVLCVCFVLFLFVFLDFFSN